MNCGPSALGWHRVADFQRCPQRFSYRWRLRLVPKQETVPLARGTVLHAMLAAYYLGRVVDAEAVELTRVNRRVVCGLEAARSLFYLYVTHYREEKLEVLAVEEEFAVRLGVERFTRRFDLVVLDSGRIWVYDHKTAFDTSERTKGDVLDPSLSTQVLVGRATLPQRFGHPWGGLVLNLIGTGSGKGPQFLRHDVIVPERVLVSLPKSIAYYLEQIAQLETTDPWAYPRSYDCLGRYGPCVYAKLCVRGPTYSGEYAVEEE